MMNLENLNLVDRSIEKCKIMTENNKVSVILLDINNNFIKDFSSIKDCSIYLKSTSSSIRYYLSGKAKGNFRNKYKFKIK